MTSTVDAVELKALGRDAGLDAVGIATAEPFLETRRHFRERRAAGLHGGMSFTYRSPERSTDPGRTLDGAKTIVVGARSYPPPPSMHSGARTAAYADDDHYGALRTALNVIAERLRTNGWQTRVLVDDNALVDREAAYRAGLGWYGKSTNLLLPGRGSWFVLGSVLTTAPLAVDDGPIDDGCGSCRRCIDGCPTGAIVAPGIVDARRCLAWLLQAKGDFPVEFRVALGDRIYGCDECQEVCPPNRRAGGQTPATSRGVDIVELLSCDDATLLERHGRWYIPDRDPRYLRRNALIVLGNTATTSDVAAVETVERYCEHPDPMLRSHATWAADRIATRVIRHLLVTNDFPPKHGGIQSYLWELWRRLPPDDVTVLTTPHPGSAEWDAEQPFRIVRTKSKVLLPTPAIAHHIDDRADEFGAALVVLDPALPLGLVGPRLRHPYGLVLHGAEVTVPGRVPITRPALRHVLRGAKVVICAGGYPLAEAERAAGRALPAINIPPGVDVERFRPLTADERTAARGHFGLPVDAPVVLGVSRLVPRKGFDTLLRACGQLAGQGREFVVAIAGHGRDRERLERIATEVRAPAHFLGRVDDDSLPSLYGAADVFAMLCRNRWGGLEQEGFGIVFLEAAATGVPQVAGRSGGAAEAVVAGESGLVVDPPDDVAAVAQALATMLDDDALRARMGTSARGRAMDEFSYDVLVARLQAALDGVGQ